MEDAAERRGVLASVIAGCHRNPVPVVLAAIALAVLAWQSLSRVGLDAIPDLAPPQVIVVTNWAGQDPERVEDQVTFPVTASLLGADGVRSVRGQSFLGVSFVYVILEEGSDLRLARTRVSERVAEVSLPDDAVPRLGPDATGIGWVFQYALRDPSGATDLAELRSIQDAQVRYALESVSGVAEVASVGGHVRQLQVTVDPSRLRAHGLGLGQVAAAIRRSNVDAGARVIEVAGHELAVRGRGELTSIDDLRDVPVSTQGDRILLLEDVAEVGYGPDMRRGVADLDGEGEVVGGIVIMRAGENALDVIADVRSRLESLRRSLPDGVELVVTYDRSELIEGAVTTLRRTLAYELLVVLLVVGLFLGSVRTAAVAAVVLPVSILTSFLPVAWSGMTVNIMTLGGILVAIGAMSDATIVMVENAQKRIDADGSSASPEVVRGAMCEVGPSLFFSLLVMTVSFLPVFLLQDVEGRLFRPLAFTKTAAMAAAALLSITLLPALVAIARPTPRARWSRGLDALLVSLYTPCVCFASRHPGSVIAVALLALLATIPAATRLRTEFMPPLNEGAILYMPASPPGISIAEATRVLRAMDRELAAIPEVARVFGKAGRADTATDPAPLSMIETVVLLKPRDQWRDGMTWDGLVSDMDRRLRFPGMPNLFWMPIQTRLEMTSTGMRGALGVKVFGPDLATADEAARRVERALLEHPRLAGRIKTAYAERASETVTLDLVLDRREAARRGLAAADVVEQLAAAAGGLEVGEVVVGRERHAIMVRYARDARDDPTVLLDASIDLPSGGTARLGDLVERRFVTGPAMVRSEAGQLVTHVVVEPDDATPVDIVAVADEVLRERVELPEGTRIEWTGQYRGMERAKERLWIAVPLCLLIIVALLYMASRSLVETGIVLLAIPFSIVGALWLLFLLDVPVSVAVIVGMIALAGLDAETGVVMLLYLRLAWRRRLEDGTLRSREDLEEVIVEGAARRIRPKLMTVLTTFVALMPVILGAGVGADLMSRIALPMAGGLASSFALELVVYPALFMVWKGRGQTRA